jgi:hypothetical protein
MNDIPDPSRHSLTAQVLPLIGSYVKKFLVNPTRFDLGNPPVPGITTVRDCDPVDAMNAEGALDYVLSMIEPYRSGGMHEFTFVPNITTAQARISKLTTYDCEPWPWPAELRGLQFIPDPNFPLTAVSLASNQTVAGRVQRPRLYLQRSYLDAETIETQAQIDFYISTVPFSRDSFLHPQPIPTEIFWSFGASEGRLLCLHDDVTIPAQSTAYQSLYGTTFGTQGNGELPAQYFPRTVMRRRAPFVVDSLLPLSETFGLFVKVRKTRFPPPVGKLTVVDD